MDTERTARGSDDGYCSAYPADGHHYVSHSVDARPIRWVEQCSLCDHISSSALRAQLPPRGSRPVRVRLLGPFGFGRHSG